MNTTTSTHYAQLPSPAQIQQTIAALEPSGIKVQLVDDAAQALDAVKALIPNDANVMTAASQSLKEIQFEALLKSNAHGWRNLKAEMLAESDPQQQGVLRMQSSLAEYYIGSVQAVTETGELITVSHSGSQIPSYAFTSRNVIWVVGVQKIVPTVEAGLRRIREYSLPLEDERAKAMGMRGSKIGKILIFEWEAPHLRRNLNLILVNQLLGV